MAVESFMFPTVLNIKQEKDGMLKRSISPWDIFNIDTFTMWMWNTWYFHISNSKQGKSLRISQTGELHLFVFMYAERCYWCLYECIF